MEEKTKKLYIVLYTYKRDPSGGVCGPAILVTKNGRNHAVFGMS